MRSLLFFIRAYPTRGLVMLGCQFLAGILGGLGVFTLLPVLGIAIQETRRGSGPAAPETPNAFERALLDAFRHLGLEPTVGVLLAFIAAMTLLAGGLGLLANTQVGYTVAHVAMDLRLRLLRALMRTRWSYFTRQPLGTLLNAFGAEANRASQSFLHGTSAASASIESLVALSLALAVSWQMTLATVALGAVFLVSRSSLVRMTRRSGRKQIRLTRTIVGRLADMLQGVKPVKAMAREGWIAPLLERETNRINRATQRQIVSKHALKALETPIITLFLCAGLWFAFSRWQMALDEVIVLALLFARTLDSVATVQRRYQEMVGEEGALNALLETIETAERECERSEGTLAPTLEREVALRHVDLSFDGKPVLRDVSLAIPAGELTALVGPSGSGKTSIGDLVLGLVQPSSGAVLVDGVPLGEIDLRAWRSTIGYVPQEMFLLHDTVAVNITLGDPSLGPAEIEWALRRASAWDFVEQLPKGIHTVVGERGLLLSGGQRQRIAIARALVHRPSLLILDEVTASLDPGTEAEVWQVAEKLRGETTLLAISHQPLLASVADRVYRIEDCGARLVKGGGDAVAQGAVSARP
jgi:ATP-binding cassette subfamily C protein